MKWVKVVLKRSFIEIQVGPHLDSYFSLLPLPPSTGVDDDAGEADADDDDDDGDEEVDEYENEDEDEDDDDNDAVESRGIKASVGWQMPTALESTVITDVGN